MVDTCLAPQESNCTTQLALSQANREISRKCSSNNIAWLAVRRCWMSPWVSLVAIVVILCAHAYINRG